MRLHPMLASLTRHKLVVLLMILTTALTSAVVTNVAVMIFHRLTLLRSPSGVQESRVITIDTSSITPVVSDKKAKPRNYLPDYEADVAVLQAIEGVTAVATVSGLPFEGGMGVDISSGPDTKVDEGFQSTAYLAGPGTLKALGMQLVRGRDFVGTEYLPAKGMSNVENVSEVIVSRALAGHLFHGGDALGRLLYISGHPVQIVGVVDHLMNMSPQLGATDNEYAMLIPLEPDGSDVTFVLNMAKKDRNSVLKRAVAVLANRHPTRVLDHAEEFSDVRDGYFQREASMVGLMLVAALALLLVTVAGTMGLMSFWMRQRTRSIGIRRALGATRSDIFRYFLTENFLIVSCGVALGCILAYGLNILLVRYFEAELLPVAYLSTGAAALWMVGLVAGFGPALRAVSVPPAVATRSL